MININNWFFFSSLNISKNSEIIGAGFKEIGDGYASVYIPAFIQQNSVVGLRTNIIQDCRNCNISQTDNQCGPWTVCEEDLVNPAKITILSTVMFPLALIFR